MHLDLGTMHKYQISSCRMRCDLHPHTKNLLAACAAWLFCAALMPLAIWGFVWADRKDPNKGPFVSDFKYEAPRFAGVFVCMILYFLTGACIAAICYRVQSLLGHALATPTELLGFE